MRDPLPSDEMRCLPLPRPPSRRVLQLDPIPRGRCLRGSYYYVVLSTVLVLLAATASSHGKALALSSSTSTSTNPIKPILVVGATGKVGRKVVQKLMGLNVPVQALVRNPQKAQDIFGTQTSLQYPPLEVFVADLGRHEEYQDVLDRAVNGCSAIISVSGAVRFSKLTDFLFPWRLFQIDVSSWADRAHPYFANYVAQKHLIELAGRHNVKRFVRLTGLGLAYSAFVPFAILFNTLISFNNRYGLLCEQALAAHSDKVPYVVLRPGGLAEDERNVDTVNVQVDATGKLPYPGRIGRTDVADLAVQACLTLPQNEARSYTLACRWCGDDIKPKPQGTMADGYPTAQECMEALAKSGAVSPPPPTAMKPYAVAVALVVYPLMFLFAKFVGWLASLALGLVLGR